jgi:UDP-3-O-[3-hydroxymyristoyl] glucosamine N-acyltransferase
VVIEDDVDIGANTCVDRAALSTTLIKRGAKIDNHCHIGHNATVHERAIVTALCMVGGHVEVKENAWIAPGAVLHNETEIGEGALVGYSALVLKDVPPGQVVAGVPARVIKSRAETRW